VLVILAVTGYPIGYAIYLSLERFDLRFPTQHDFIGLANYGAVLSSGYWWQAFAITVIITVVSVAIEFVIALALALAMRRTVVGRGLVRAVVLIPYSIVTVVASYSWQYAWTPGKGYLAALLPEGVAPLTDQVTAIAVIVLVEVWKTTPFMALLLLAGLALVPEDLLKAAAIDGAGPWQRLTRVILPIMKPAILVALLFRTLDAFRVFDVIYILTRGSHGTESVSILGYDNLFIGFNFGIGSAISVLIFLIVAIIAVVFVKLFGVAAPGARAQERR
jgi:multiple sugar transport system permease protein